MILNVVVLENYDFSGKGNEVISDRGLTDHEPPLSASEWDAIVA